MDDRALSADELLDSLDEKNDSFSIFGYVMYAIVILLVFAVFLFGFFISFIQVDGDSMLDTLENKQFIIFQKRGYSLERGDVITVKNADPDEPKKLLIKRLIALSGDTFMFMRNENPRYVDLYLCKSGETHFTLCEEPYIRAEMLASVDYKSFTVAPFIDYIEEIDITDEQSQNAQIRQILSESAVTVPQKSFLFLGDNRNISLDAREYGLQPTSNISGKALKFLEKTSFLHKFLTFLYN